MFSDVFLLQIWIFPDVLVDVFVFSFAACWFGDVWCWLLASRWSIMKPPALTFAVSTASGPPSSHVPIWSHLGMDQYLHVYIYIYIIIYISKSKHIYIYVCVFSGRINIQLMYESYGGQHQFPTQGFLMAFRNILESRTPKPASTCASSARRISWERERLRTAKRQILVR